MEKAIHEAHFDRKEKTVSSEESAVNSSTCKSESKLKSLIPAFFNALLLAMVGAFLTSVFKNIETRQRAYDEYRKSAVRLHDDLTTAASGRLYAARNTVVQMDRSGYRDVKKSSDTEFTETKPSLASDSISKPPNKEIFDQMRPAIDASMREYSTQMMDWNRMVVARSQAIRRVFGMSIQEGEFKNLNEQLNKIGGDLERQYKDVILGIHPGEKPLCNLTDKITNEGFGAVFSISGEMLKRIDNGEVKRRWEQGEGRNYPIFGWR